MHALPKLVILLILYLSPPKLFTNIAFENDIDIGKFSARDEQIKCIQFVLNSMWKCNFYFTLAFRSSLSHRPRSTYRNIYTDIHPTPHSKQKTTPSQVRTSRIQCIHFNSSLRHVAPRHRVAANRRDRIG